MADEEPIVAGRRRSKGSEAMARAGALERLKALRSGGRKSESGGYQFKMENPIYDMIDEDEYDALVAKRREEVRGFIIDDDGLGYGDEGEEEDWSRAGLPPSSDESDGESERPKRKKVEKKEPRPKKPSSISTSLSAAAAMMGKQRLSSMFTSSVFKKNRDEKSKGLSSDSIVDDVIAEFAPDEADRERRRRVQGSSLPGPKSFVPAILNVKSERVSTLGVDVLGVPEFPRVVRDGDSELNRDVENGDSVLNYGEDCEEVKEQGLVMESEKGKNLNAELGEAPLAQFSDSADKGDVVKEKTVNVVEAKLEPEVKKKEAFTLNAKTKEEKDPALSATAGWKAVRNEGIGDIGTGLEVDSGSNSEENLDFDLDSDGSLPFYIIDAHEEFYGANMGTLYLFGKVNGQFDM